MPSTSPSRRHLLLGAGGTALLAAGAGTGYAVGWRPEEASATRAGVGARAAAVSPVSILAPDVVHEVSIAMPQETFERLHTAYASNGEKAWARAEVTLDGTTYADAGVRLKGHSTLDRVGAGQPASAYPWLIRLDKYVDGQRHGGVAELAIRTNNSASHLNEAVALDLLARAGLAGQAGAYARVRIGPAGTGEQPVLRMLVENPGDAWAERVLGGGGLLYKAEAGGDYSYRGSDPAAYDGVFDQEAGGEDLEPLIAFLDLVNNASESDLATRLPEQLDVAAFGTYRAFEALVDNYDAIDGPGNNSYLWWDTAASRMTVIGWDHNLTFGVSNRPGGGGGGGVAGGGGGGGGGAGAGGGVGRGPGRTRTNALVTRAERLAQWSDLYAAATATVQDLLTTQGPGVLSQWSSLLTSQAGALVPAGSVSADAARIEAYF
ncbi:MAG: CotH kinase family protein [Dermatophilaceae bacterium]